MKPSAQNLPDSVSVPNDNTTLTDVIVSYADGGFPAQFGVVADGMIECQTCGVASRPGDVEMHSRRRLEGASDPDDTVAVMAVTCPACGARGVVIAQVGPMASSEDATVTSGLKDHRDDSIAPSDASPADMPDEKFGRG
jgi:hypothetical protein